jgi:AraC family transcriptional activator of pyochelin receptor
MAALVLNSADIIDFSTFPSPQEVGLSLPSNSSGDFATHYHPKAGTIKYKSTGFPHMHLMDIRWTTNEEIKLYDSTPDSTVNINFQMSGQLDTRFFGLKQELHMRPHRHNLVFAPEGGDLNHIRANSSIEMFHLSLDKVFFADAIGCDDAWSETVLKNLDHGRPFAGANGTVDTTHQMLRLISEIRNCAASGPMRNLLIQSRALELIAFQIGQFRNPFPVREEIRLDDAEKLHQLKGHLERNFLAETSLTELSRIFVLNEFKVKKGFRALFGTSVFAYLRQLRMEYAGNLLRNCNTSVEEVADVLGYEHAQHFSIAFKKFTGRTPSEFKTKGSSKTVAV